jgi:hypothetical protein
MRLVDLPRRELTSTRAAVKVGTCRICESRNSAFYSLAKVFSRSHLKRPIRVA